LGACFGSWSFWGLKHIAKVGEVRLVGLVITVIGIPCNVIVRPIEPDATAPINDESDLYFALCSREHSMLDEGATSDGFWAGPPRNSFYDPV
jgi:hypothetical protein